MNLYLVNRNLQCCGEVRFGLFVPPPPKYVETDNLNSSPMIRTVSLKKVMSKLYVYCYTRASGEL